PRGAGPKPGWSDAPGAGAPAGGSGREAIHIRPPLIGGVTERPALHSAGCASRKSRALLPLRRSTCEERSAHVLRSCAVTALVSATVSRASAKSISRRIAC